MYSRLPLSRRIEADLRNYPSRCIALESEGECIVCWKAPDAEAQVLSRRDTPLGVRLIYAEWDSLDPLTGAQGDALYLFFQAENRVYSGLARLENKELVEDLARQRTLKIFILDNQLNIVGDVREIDWDEGNRTKAKRELDRFLKYLQADPVRYGYFVRPNSAVRLSSSSSALPGRSATGHLQG